MSATPDSYRAGLQAHDAERARHLLTLEFGSRREFDDPRYEFRRLFSELLGTFFLVLVAAGGGLLHAEGQPLRRRSGARADGWGRGCGAHPQEDGAGHPARAARPP